MGVSKNGKAKKINRMALRSVAVSVLVISFFVGVILAFYFMLYSETTDRIIKSGELTANASAREIDKYLSTGIDTMRLACYTLDNMIRDGSTYEEIDTFIINQSTALSNMTSENTTGLYGYINDIYMDGTDWVPDDDYVPTERPWYIGARASIGKVAVVDPYLDAQTHTIMITLAKTLCDAKSVAAMDFSLEYLQKMTEKLEAESEADMEIVLDGNYDVITHSDSSQLGRNYISEEGTFGRVLVDNLRATDDNYFSFRYRGADYIVYNTTVANDWNCLSVFDATDDFNQLRNLLVYTIIAAVLVVVIQMIIMLYSAQKDRETREAVAANEAKSSFLSNMSHEIRTPINAVLGMNEMILRESSESSIIEYSENIRTAGNTLLGIVNDVLDFSKIEAGKMEIVPVEYDFSSVLIDLDNMIRVRAESKGLLLRLDINRDIPKRLFGDEVRIKQVITNILTNAVKYTEKGSVTLGVDFEKDQEDSNSVYMLFSVKDTGIGIKPEDMKKLYSEFERIEEKRNRNIEGTGLGMSITSSLLKLMGTSLEVSSVYGEGSVFSFRLKQRVVNWEALGDYEAAFRESLDERKKYHEKFTAPEAVILVVDDTEMNLQVVENLLKRTDIQIDTATRGAEALVMCAKKKYDVIFLDHMMPEMDGIETLKKLRADTTNPNLRTPSICLTANAISGSREKYLSVGFEDYLTKPIDADKIEEILIRYLPQEKISTITDNDDVAEDEQIPQYLMDCEGLDVQQGVDNSGGVEGYLNVLKGFYSYIDDKSGEIQSFFDAGDISNLTIKVHGLKSSARIIGAMELSSEAEKLEAAGKSGDLDYIKENLSAMLDRYRSYKDILLPVVEKKDDLPEASQEFLDDAYSALEEFASVEDYDCVRMVIESTEEYSLKEEDKKRFEKALLLLYELNWDGILELAKNR